MKNLYYYIEPYIHIESQDNYILFYNTLNGEVIESNKEYIIHLFKDYKNNENQYFFKVSDDEPNKEDVIIFFNNLRDSYMCDYIHSDSLNKKPVILKNECKVLDTLYDINTKAYSSSNISYLKSYLRELTIIVNNITNSKPNLNKIYFQASNKIDILNESGELNSKNIDNIFNLIESCPIDYIHIVGSDIVKYSNKLKLFEYLNRLDVVKILNFSIENLVRDRNDELSLDLIEFFKDLDRKFSIINVFVDSSLNKTDLEKITKLVHEFNLHIEFQFIAETNEDVSKIESVINEFAIENYSLLPYYNGNNYLFFKENVFLAKGDIMDLPPQSSKDLLIKSSINSNYYGKLIIASNGDIYSNVHTPTVGNLESTKLHEIIYNEIDDGNWVKTRTKIKPCKECVYNKFCPPINNYEFDLRINNLCHFQEKK